MPDEGDLGWKISLPCTRAEARMLSEDSFFMASSDTVPTIVTREVDESQPDEWAIDVYFEARPDAAMLENIATLAPDSSGKPTLSQLGDEDWLVKSQQGLEPLRAGRFHIHTFDSPPHEDPAITNIRMDAGQAFGTGHHETTSGCLETLDHLRRHGKRYNNIIDVGTGTGLLAFAAHHLWPTAKIMNELGMTGNATAVAQHYGALIDGFILDQRDAALTVEIATSNLAVITAQTIMNTLDDRIDLAHTAIQFLHKLS